MTKDSSASALDRARQEHVSWYAFANKMGRIFFLALEEVTAGQGLSAILASAGLQDRRDGYPPNNFAQKFPFNELGRIQQALEELHGPRRGRELAREIGGACFRIGAQDLRPVLGLADLAFQILPLTMRLNVGLEILAVVSGRFSDQIVRLEEDMHSFVWVVERCGVCWGRRSDTPCCHLSVGLLQEGLYWFSGGESFHVEEVSCIATGDVTCTLLIDKRPSDKFSSSEGGSRAPARPEPPH
ncbi:MAG: 4-vinyl reductase [Anaerolineae bacterium]|jgi:hypothetical protein